METYYLLITCCKCSGEDIFSQHKKYDKDRRFSSSEKGPDKEHIRCYCRNCGYEWYMQTQDKD